MQVGIIFNFAYTTITHKDMQPIDKFTNIDAVYPTLEAKEEDSILDYVWQLAILIHPAIPKK